MVLEGYRSNAPFLMLLKEPVDIISRCFLDNDWNIKLHPSFPQGFFVHDILCMTACQAQGKWCRPKPKQVLCSVSTALPLALVSAEADFESQIRTARPWKIRSFTARNWRAETAEWPWNKNKLIHSKVPFHPLSLFQRLKFQGYTRQAKSWLARGAYVHGGFLVVGCQFGSGHWQILSCSWEYTKLHKMVETKYLDVFTL